VYSIYYSIIPNVFKPFRALIPTKLVDYSKLNINSPQWSIPQA
jgi:hypothetical protein